MSSVDIGNGIGLSLKEMTCSRREEREPAAVAKEYRTRAWELDLPTGNVSAAFVGRSNAPPSRSPTLNPGSVVTRADRQVAAGILEVAAVATVWQPLRLATTQHNHRLERC